MNTKMIRNFFGLLVMILLLTSAVQAKKIPYRIFSSSRNVTSEFSRAMDISDEHPLDSTQLERLKDFKIIFIPGIFANLIVGIGEAGGLRARFGEYFTEQMTYLTKNGIENERLNLESEESPEVNAIEIRQAIRNSRKPVILITHSKGGLDSLEALINYPELQEKVRGWIPLQSPFQGSPVADFFKGLKLLTPVTLDLIRLLNGSPRRFIDSLTVAERVPYISERVSKIQELAHNVAIITVATTKEKEFLRVDTSLAIFRDALLKEGLASDGVVPWHSTILPDVDYVAVKGADHLMLVMHSRFNKFNRLRFTETLLSMLLERI